MHDTSLGLVLAEAMAKSRCDVWACAHRWQRSPPDAHSSFSCPSSLSGQDPWAFFHDIGLRQWQTG